MIWLSLPCKTVRLGRGDDAIRSTLVRDIYAFSCWHDTSWGLQGVYAPDFVGGIVFATFLDGRPIQCLLLDQDITYRQIGAEVYNREGYSQ